VQDVLGPGQNDDIGSVGGNSLPNPTATSLPHCQTSDVTPSGWLKRIGFHKQVLTQPWPTAVYITHSPYTTKMAAGKF